MKQNIFYGAKFGDRFRTRDGRMAVLWCIHEEFKRFMLILPSKQGELGDYVSCGTDGKWRKDIETEDDIVSRWQEQIDEEELDTLAIKQRELCHAVGMISFDASRSEEEIIEEVFKAGYRAAKNNE